MDELFEKLKAEPPVNRKDFSSTITRAPSRKTGADDFQSNKNDSSRRESLPALEESATRSSLEDASSSINKCRSISPSDIQINKNYLDRKEMKESSMKIDALESSSMEESTDIYEESPKKQMPTKAQQKLFEPATNPIFIPTNDNKIKQCKVRIKRQNLIQLQKAFANEQNKKSKNTKIKLKPATESPKSGSKRTAEHNLSPPTKKSRASNDLKQKTTVQKKGKPDAGFFIKLNSSPPLPKKEPVIKQRSKTQSPTGLREKPTKKANSRGVSSSPVWTTKATKFTRTQLIKAFGKRYFNSVVRIKRCRHPLMITFESDAFARKHQGRNKSKNLSVSFKEQVEIIGCSDSESSYSEENAAAVKDSSKASEVTTLSRLKKIKNGKVIEDIEYDTSLFLDSDFGSDSSTPLRKKTEKKSYSPLKDDSSPSARSEQLKLANEKLPPCGLRRLRDATAEDDDDEDDECEYIVPFVLPEKRSSRASSLNSTTDPMSSTKEIDADVISPNDTNGSKTVKEDILPAIEIESNLNTTKEDLIQKDKVDFEKDIPNESPQQNISQSPASSKEIEHVNGNERRLNDIDLKHKDEKNSSIKAGTDTYESNNLVQESDSCALTPGVSITSDIDENVDNTKEIEKLQINIVEEKENTSTIDKITADTKTTIST